MKPENQTARTRSINKFLIVYGLSLLVVILSAWFLFNTPAGLFKTAIQSFKVAEDEQTRLVNKVDGITANLKSIAQADQTYLSSNNDIEKGGLQANLQEYQKRINDALIEVKNDSSGFVSVISKKNSYNYITTFNAILTYRNTLASLQKMLAEKGGEVAELMKVKSMLETCNSQLDLYKALAAAKPAPAAPPPSGGGSSNKDKEALQQLQQQLDQNKADLTACLKAKGATVPVVSSVNFDEASKATVLFEAGEGLYNTASKTKNLIEKRGILSAAKSIFERSQGAYPNPDKVKKTITQIDAELKRLSNIG